MTQGRKKSLKVKKKMKKRRGIIIVQVSLEDSSLWGKINCDATAGRIII